MTLIREAKLNDLDELIKHLIRHFEEPGVGGVIAQPFSETEPFEPAEYKERVSRRWRTLPGEGQWEKMWLLEDTGQIVGHIELIGVSKRILAHRCRLGMGIETKYRSQGYGKKLITTAIQWAESLDFLSWIDLDVFAHNTAALNLYRKAGFIVVGNTPDRLRVSGNPIDDIHMVRPIRKNLPETIESGRAQVQNIENLEHIELSTKSEKLSHSALLTDTTNFQKLFVHHEIIPPSRRSSTPHYHTHTEEMFLVLEGNPTFHYGESAIQGRPGDFICLPAGERKLHYVSNESDAVVRVLGICGDDPLDTTCYAVETEPKC